jgi:protein-S-isoprenylcysteine O-methyltransferase Ste14
VRLARQLLAVLLLPGTVAGLIPALLVLPGADLAPWPLALPGAALLALGLGMIAWTVTLFARIGRGTLAPWDETSHLVVSGPYRHVRNPMISGVLAVLLGEAALFGSWAVLGWFGFVFALNAVYFPLVEEPGLRDRFGAEYDEYAARTPRWIPR